MDALRVPKFTNTMKSWWKDSETQPITVLKTLLTDPKPEALQGIIQSLFYRKLMNTFWWFKMQKNLPSGFFNNIRKKTPQQKQEMFETTMQAGKSELEPLSHILTGFLVFDKPFNPKSDYEKIVLPIFEAKRTLPKEDIYPYVCYEYCAHLLMNTAYQNLYLTRLLSDDVEGWSMEELSEINFHIELFTDESLANDMPDVQLLKSMRPKIYISDKVYGK